MLVFSDLTSEVFEISNISWHEMSALIVAEFTNSHISCFQIFDLTISSSFFWVIRAVEYGYNMLSINDISLISWQLDMLGRELYNISN